MVFCAWHVHMALYMHWNFYWGWEVLGIMWIFCCLWNLSHLCLSLVYLRLLRHGNKRRHDMFHPNEGQFIEAIEDNVYQARGTLSVSLPHLANFSETSEQAFHDHSYSKARFHSVTRTSSHAAYDRFHEHNSSVPEVVKMRPIYLMSIYHPAILFINGIRNNYISISLTLSYIIDQ